MELNLCEDVFVNHLFSTGIYLLANADVLVWELNKVTRKVTAQLMYQYLANCFLVQHVKGILHYIWEGKLPLKIKCFEWLCINQKILTWGILQKRGFNGPSWCCLCHADRESSLHIFGNCNFFSECLDLDGLTAFIVGEIG